LQGFFGEERGFTAWGLSARSVTRPYANRNQLDEARGVWVTSKTPDLPADKAELEVGDVILEVAGTPVMNIEDFGRLYSESTRRKDATIPLKVRQGRTLKTLVLEVDSAADAGQ
jgi:S1-C subfamily serine protease